MFCAYLAQKIFWKPKPFRALAIASEAETRRAAGRGTSTERVTEGEQGKNWRNGARTEIVRIPGRLLRTHSRKLQTIQSSVSPPSIAASNHCVQCPHTQLHRFRSTHSNRATQGRQRRRHPAASIQRCLLGE